LDVPVVHLRIDNRLVHGQVTLAWVGALDVDHIIVANDEVAGDELQRLLLPQAARGVRTPVLTIDHALSRCKDVGAERERAMVIAKLPSDALRLVDGGLDPSEVNVGNQAPRSGTRFTMVARSIAVTAEDAATYRQIAAKGHRLVSKMMPSDKPADFLQLLDRKGL
jgi:PTS system mannose-specific IIB component